MRLLSHLRAWEIVHSKDFLIIRHSSTDVVNTVAKYHLLQYSASISIMEMLWFLKKECPGKLIVQRPQ